MAPEPTATPFFRLDPTGRFSDRAGEYAAGRPSYPAAAIDAVLEGLGKPAGLTAADVGAGTGIFARLLADRGVTVLAIEPNAEMSKAASPHPKVRFREGQAEATGLAAGAVDLVTAAQAFHWFEPAAALAEMRRVLRPGGRLALIWNVRDESNPPMAWYIAAILAAGADRALLERPFESGLVTEQNAFAALPLVEIPYEQRLDHAGLMSRALSASYVPKTEEARQILEAKMRDLVRGLGDERGVVTLRYITRVYRFTAR